MVVFVTEVVVEVVVVSVVVVKVVVVFVVGRGVVVEVDVFVACGACSRESHWKSCPNADMKYPKS